MVFGRPVRPSTPINEVLEFKYQDDWIEQQRQQRVLQEQKEQAKKIPPGVVRENRTSQLRRSHTCFVPDDRDLWKLPKFTNTQRQLDTFRTETDRERAYRNRPVVAY
jgi:hypothetical protein